MADPPPITDEDYRSIGAFRRAIREFLAVSERGARSHGLTSQQHQALLAIRSHQGPQPITVGELADSLLIRSHSALRLVNRLVDQRLVTRRTSDQDRRRVLLELDPRASAILEAITLRNMAELSRAAEILKNILGTAREIDSRRNKGRGGA